ncbi:MAG: GNAT family N-acetyltransferase [Proteobacteria bacterium]|nr:GNAT family N-acetyltransferase [Pseudomonadota bacterium]
METISAPETLTTERLFIRRPRLDDAESVFTRYDSDVDVTRFLGWARHDWVEQTLEFLQYSNQKWEQDQVGPYLIFDKMNDRLLGGTGLEYESKALASTGYVLARDSWGSGYATEALHAIVEIARGLPISSVYALCHPEHIASVRVLEKCGFNLEAKLSNHIEFPNLELSGKSDVLHYSLCTQ